MHRHRAEDFRDTARGSDPPATTSVRWFALITILMIVSYRSGTMAVIWYRTVIGRPNAHKLDWFPAVGVSLQSERYNCVGVEGWTCKSSDWNDWLLVSSLLMSVTSSDPGWMPVVPKSQTLVAFRVKDTDNTSAFDALSKFIWKYFDLNKVLNAVLSLVREHFHFY